MHKDGAFTLIELLVVIGIIAILSIVVVLVLNPSQLLMQSRDSNRISDMATMQEAIQTYITDQSSGVIGSSSVVYVSIADSAATSTAGDQCQGLGLPSLPSTYSYHCAASSTLKNVDGTGWIPIKFTAASFRSPIGSLAVDPINTSSSRNYYTYAANGSQFEITAPMESQKYKFGGSNDVITNDGGILATVYEKGTGFGLEPMDYGDTSLIGYWPLDEGANGVAYDYSGTNATGSWSGTQAGTSGYYSGGLIGSYAGTFNGSNDYVTNSANNAIFTLTTGVTMVAWVKLSGLGVDQKVISKRPSYVLTVYNNNIPETEIFIGGVSYDTRSASGGTTLTTGQWYQLAGTYDGSTLKTYVNGVLDRQISVSGSMDATAFPITIGKTADSAANYFNGLIDDARVYNRALSAAEIAALYKGNK